MNKIKNLSINFVIPFVVFLFFIVLQSSIFFFEYKQKQQQLYNQEIDYIKGITGNLQNTLPDALSHLKKHQIKNIISQITLDANLKTLAVIDNDQKIIVSNFVNQETPLINLQSANFDLQLSQQISPSNEFILQHNQLTEELTVYAPVTTSTNKNNSIPEFNNLIFINYSMKPAISVLRVQALQALFTFTVSLLLTLILLISIMKRFISNPLNNIVQSIKSAKLQDSVAIVQTGFGEVGLLQKELVAISEPEKNCRDKISFNEQRLLHALSGTRDGLWDWDIQQDKVFYSERWKEMLGFEI